MAKMNITEMQADKLLHFSFTAIIACAFKFITFVITSEYIGSAFLGFFVASSIGFLKEVYDMKTGKVFDRKDIIADILGALVGAV